jgi:hypothetical protein
MPKAQQFPRRARLLREDREEHRNGASVKQSAGLRTAVGGLDHGCSSDGRVVFRRSAGPCEICVERPRHRPVASTDGIACDKYVCTFRFCLFFVFSPADGALNLGHRARVGRRHLRRQPRKTLSVLCEDRRLRPDIRVRADRTLETVREADPSNARTEAQTRRQREGRGRALFFLLALFGSGAPVSWRREKRDNCMAAGKARQSHV